MYVPEHFNEADLARLDWLAQHDAFGTLVSSVEGAPFASHLPVLYRRDAQRVTLTGHWARPNPQWRGIEGQRVLFIFHGPHSYISPRWYVEPRKHVPTWNYAVAHLYGRIRLLEDRAALTQIVTALADKYEGGAPDAWSVSAAESRILDMLRGIVGFELAVEEIQLKFKLSQNHPRANAEGAIRGLQALPADDAQAVVALMQDALGREQ
ncbi:MAG TPA: FMN-binding negative transcriptional regulator [Steroidobacteraceae bacterium]|jgi:transcriptional regulator|nr:FMN-binding negative transcriptional regulator [Steroidobacteraceae bacterium]